MVTVQEIIDTAVTPQGATTGDGTRAGGQSLSTDVYGPQEVLSAPTTSPTATAPAPAPAPTGGTTIQDSIANVYSGIGEAQTMLDSIVANEAGPVIGSFDQETTTTPFDEDAARQQAQREQLRLHQAEIDATNQIYDEQLRVARLEGEGRIGSTRAIGARGGILGSSFAGAQKAGQQSANTAEQNAINAVRSAKIGTIMGNVRSSVLAQVEDKRQAYALGADALLANIASGASRKENNINSFAADLIAQGFDITDISDEELKAFATEAGVTADDLVAGFHTAKADIESEDSEDGYKFYSTSDGLVRVNTATGESEGAFGFDSSGGGSSSSGGSRFTTTQVNKGAANAGMPIADFQQLSVDEQNAFINRDSTQGFSDATMYVDANRTATDEELKAALSDPANGYNLSAGEITNIIKARTRELDVDDAMAKTIITKLYGADDNDLSYEQVQEYIEKGHITTGGTTYTLSAAQQQALMTELDSQQGFFQGIIPGGK